MYLSVVVPCFNEQEVIAVFCSRTADVCKSLLSPDSNWQIVLVNDGSTDKTYERMQELAVADPHILIVNLSRNYGHQIALTAGLQICRGEVILILDADLQDPPELLPLMLDAMRQNRADVVYGQRRERKGENVFKIASSAVFYRVLNSMVDLTIPVDTGDFRLMSRRALKVLNEMPEQQRFIRGMVSWIGLRQVPFLYDRDVRLAGETKYPTRKMLGFAMDAITSFSVKPLRFASYTGVFVGLLGFIALLYTLGSWALGSVVQGWTSAVSLMLVLGGVQLLMLGVIGEYLGRLYIEAKRRPLYVIDDIVTYAEQARED